MEAGAQLFGERLDVVGRRCNVPLVGDDLAIALLHGIPAQKDDGVGRRTFGRSTIEGENLRLAVDLDRNASRTVAIGRGTFNAADHVVPGEGRGRQLCEDWKSDHTFSLRPISRSMSSNAREICG